MDWQNRRSISQTLINMANDTSLEQIVNFQTRGSNILDLLFMNRPSLVSRCEVSEGVSDHEAIYVEAEVAVKRLMPIPY